MSVSIEKIVDISLELDDSKFSMRTPLGFKKDLQFRLEVLKEHDAAEGAGQIVRGVHMRLHAGSHIDAPEHNVKGGKQVQDLPLGTFAGDAVIADLRHLVPGKAITAEELERTVGAVVRRGDRLLLRTDVNKTYMIDDWMKRSPYLRSDGTRWCIDKGVVLVGYDFYHGVDEPDSNIVFYTSRTFGENGVITMPYLNNLDLVTQDRNVVFWLDHLASEVLKRVDVRFELIIVVDQVPAIVLVVGQERLDDRLGDVRDLGIGHFETRHALVGASVLHHGSD